MSVPMSVMNPHLPSRRGPFLATIAWMAMLLVGITNHPTLALSSPGNYPDRKIALVTGSNKGIGYEIARKLLSHKHSTTDEHEFVCVLGCRNLELGKEAAKSLAEDTGNSRVDLVRIDLTDSDSIQAAATYMEDAYGRCDVLVNNAAVCYNDPTLYGVVPHTPFARQAEITIATNFFGTLALTRAVLPLLRASSSVPRIVNIASSAGRLSIIPSEERREALSSESLSLPDLEAMMQEFVEAAADGTHASQGWPNTGYGVSKVGIIAMTKILARTHNNNADGNGGESSSFCMLVNSVDPGYCATDQNNNQGFIPAERGAVTPYLLATLPDDQANEFTGRHWYQEQEIAW